MDPGVLDVVRRCMPQNQVQQLNVLDNIFVLLWDIDVEIPIQFADRFRHAMISRGWVWENLAVCNLVEGRVLIILKSRNALGPIYLDMKDLYFWAFFSGVWFRFQGCPLDFTGTQCIELPYEGSYSDLHYDHNQNFSIHILRQAVYAINRYHGNPNEIRRFLVQPIVFVCESVRLRCISDLLSQNYYTYCVLDLLTRTRIHCWSKLVLARIDNNFGPVEYLEVRNVEECDQVLAVIKRSPQMILNLGNVANLVQRDNSDYDGQGGGGNSRSGSGGISGRREEPVDGCGMDLSSGKDYCRKHWCPESHSNFPRFIVASEDRPLCHQCNRCLSDHNANPHKPQPITFSWLPSPFCDERRQIIFMWKKIHFGLMRPVTGSSWEGLPEFKFSNEKELWVKPAKANGGLVDGQMLHLGSQNGSHIDNMISGLSNPFLTLSYDVDGLLLVKGTTVQVTNQGQEATATAVSNLDGALDIRHARSLLSSPAATVATSLAWGGSPEHVGSTSSVLQLSDSHSHTPTVTLATMSLPNSFAFWIDPQHALLF